MKKEIILLSLLLSMLPQLSMADSDEPTPGWVIDLGLSVNWASYNLGASSPEGYGGYYAWGETKEKEYYSLATYTLYSKENGYKSISDISGNPEYDAARANWGGDWRMPTWSEAQELIDKCKIKRIIYKDIAGFLFTGPNGNSIFLPGAGFHNEDYGGVGNNGTYRTSTPYNVNKTDQLLIMLYFSASYDNNKVRIDGSDAGYIGRSIRPVIKKGGDTGEPTPGKVIDLGLSVDWAGYNVGATTPEEYGNYYSWGETETKVEYTINNYKYYYKEEGKNGRYVLPGTYYTNNSRHIEGSSYDVAHVKWGGDWRIPTEAEMQELINKCASQWITYKGVDGRLYIGPNGNKIFLPAAANSQHLSTTKHEIGSYNTSVYARGGVRHIYFHSGRQVIEGSDPWIATPIRPVIKKGGDSGTGSTSPDDAITLIAESYTRIYGDPNPVFDYTSSGAKAGEPVIKCAATATSPVGTYPIVIEKGSVSNSDVTLVNGTLTITEAPLIISVGNYTKMEGEDNPEFKLSYSDFKNNETESVLSKKPTVTCNATKDSKAGNYEIVVSGASATNYYITYQSGTLTIKAKGSDTPDDINGEVFTAKTAEGLEMTFKVTSGANKTCKVGTGDGKEAVHITHYIEHLTIPDEVNGYKVTKISERALSNLYVGSFTLPSGLKTIEDQAFWACNNLKSIVIPKTVTEIGYGVLGSCKILESIIVEDGNLVYDSRNGCNAIIETKTNTLKMACSGTKIPESIAAIDKQSFRGVPSLDGSTAIQIPEGVIRIGEESMWDSGFTSITLPNSLESIETKAFDISGKLDKLYIPKGVKSIGSTIIYPYQLGSVEVSKDNQVYDSRNNCNAIIETNSDKLILGCMSTVIPSGVKIIGEIAFSTCQGLETIKIPEGVTEIQRHAFYRCYDLASVTIPSTLNNLGGNSLGLGGVFSQCDALRSVTSYIKSPFKINDNNFPNDTYASGTLYVSKGTKSLYQSTDGWKNFKNIIEADLEPVGTEEPKEDDKKKGDLTGDGEVNGTDLVLLIEYVLSGRNDVKTADLNGDGLVNGTDLVMLVNMILGK